MYIFYPRPRNKAALKCWFFFSRKIILKCHFQNSIFNPFCQDVSFCKHLTTQCVAHYLSSQTNRGKDTHRLLHWGSNQLVTLQTRMGVSFHCLIEKYHRISSCIPVLLSHCLVKHNIGHSAVILGRKLTLCLKIQTFYHVILSSTWFLLKLRLHGISWLLGVPYCR